MSSIGPDLFNATNAELARKVEAAVAQAFPLATSDGRVRLEVENVKVRDDQHTLSLHAQQNAREQAGTIAVPVTADISLWREGKKVQSLRTFRLGQLPLLTPLGTFTVKGNDYFTPKMLRLKPGVYTREAKNGDFESFINLKGRPMTMWMEPARGVLKLGTGSTNVNLYPILKALGATDNDMLEAFGRDSRGRELLTKNTVKDERPDIQKFAQAILGRKENRDLVRAGLVEQKDPTEGMDDAAKRAALQEWFAKQAVDPFVTRKTLGQEFTKASRDLLLATAKKLINVSRREAEPDDRDALEFKTLHDVADMLPERLTKVARMLKYGALNKMGKPDSTIASILGTDWLNPALTGYFGGTGKIEGGMANTHEAANPLAILGEHTKTTVVGDGGISETRAITDSARLFRPGMTGFIDAVHSPEGASVGVTTHLAVNAFKTPDNHVASRFYPIVDGKVEKKLVTLTVEQASDSVIGYPEFWDKDGKPTEEKVRAIVHGQIQDIEAGKVQYVVPSGAAMFDHTSNAALFFAHTHPNRGMMAGKHLSQALPLTHREAPLSDLKVNGSKESVFEKLGRAFTVSATEDGIVEKVGSDKIVVSGKTYELFDHYPMQAKVALHHVPVVKVGDHVKKGQLLAENNYTRDGKLALGVNLRSAYLPWKNASNYEDAIVISESAAHRLSSDHVHRYTIDLEPDRVVSSKMLMAQFPTVLTSEMLKNLDDSGVVKVGSKVALNDVLIASLDKRKFDEKDRTAKNLATIHKSLLNPYKNSSITFDLQHPGEVYRVIRRPDAIEVHVKTSEPVQVGDKLSMSSAAKGTVAQIVPDHEMPHGADKKPIEVIFNPHGVAGRINPSQTIEQAAGKLVKKWGEKYDHANFDGVDHATEIKKRLAAHGDTHVEPLFDPTTGKWLESPVATGYNYVYKLDHSVRKKFSARETGGYTADEAPTRGSGKSGQSYDQLTTFALLGHNAHAMLGESAGIRGQKNEDFWVAYQAGEALPPPKVPFVFEKFRALMLGAGVNMIEKDGIAHWMPVTDKVTREKSNGEINVAAQLRARGTKAFDVVESKGGLFDPEITGGAKGGAKWAHVELSEKIPHPLYEKVINDVLGIKRADYYGLLGHTRHYDPKTGKFNDEGHGVTGEQAFEKLLSFNVEDKLADTRRRLATAVGSDKNRLYRASRYLRGLQETNLTPADAYLTKVVPVVPPVYRPILEMKGGALRVADANYLYRDLILAKDQLDKSKNFGMPPEHLRDARMAVYGSLAALVGVNNALTHRDDRLDEAAGFIDVIKGRENKTGLFQRGLARRRNDLTGRSTVEPDGSLGPEEIGLPEDMAWKIFKPMVVRRMVQHGWTPMEAQEQVDKRTMAARAELDAERKENPVLYNRAPSLHRWSVGSAYAHIHPGQEIRVSPATFGPTGGDADGNCCIGRTALTLMYEGPAWEVFQKDAAMRTTADTLIITTTPTGAIVRMPIKDIPRIESTRTLDKNGASVYAVPTGISVLTTSADGKGVRFSPVTKMTVEEGCTLETVTTSGGHAVTVSNNESLAVFDHQTGSVVRVRPADAHGRLAPVAKTLAPGLPEGPDEDFDLGWLMGAFCGDGFFMGGCGHVGFTKLESSVRAEFERLMVSQGSRISGTYHGFANIGGKLGDSVKTHFTRTTDVAQRVLSACYVAEKDAPQFEGARACLRKTAPPSVFASRQALLGFLSGMLDTDGSIVVANAKAKKSSQIMVSFSTSSPWLRDSIVLACRMLGIRASYSTTQPANGRLQKFESYCIYASSIDVKSVGTQLRLKAPVKKARLQALMSAELRECRDIIPLPYWLLDYTHDTKGVFGKTRTLLVTLRSAKGKSPFPTVSRETAERAVAVLEEAGLIETNEQRDWVALVRDASTRWERVTSVEPAPTEVVYDLEVPETKIFVVNDGLVIYDTYSITVPVTAKAQEESKQLLARNNLFYDKNKSLVFVADKDVVTGLYQLTRPGVPSGQSFETADDALYHFANNEQPSLRTNSLVKIKGSPTEETIGWLLLKKEIPARFLAGVAPPMDGKKLEKILRNVAESSPSDYNAIARSLTQAGFRAAPITGGVTTSIDELTMDRSKVKRLLEQLDHNIKSAKTTDAKTKIALDGAKSLFPVLNKEVTEHLAVVDHGYNAFINARLGGKISPDQFRQMIVSPVFVKDIKDQVIPAVIKSSYGEGMRPSDYLMATPGARKGMVDKSLATAMPGAMAKSIAAGVSDVRIYEKDCNTHRGIEAPLTSSFRNGDVDLLDRHLAVSVPGVAERNDVVTPAVLAKARDKGLTSLLVRSPMTCEAARSPCQMCAGRDASGALHPLGANIGLNYGQTLSERSTQLILRCQRGDVRIKGAYISFASLWARYESRATVDREVKTVRFCDGELTVDCPFTGETPAYSLERHAPDAPVLLVQLDNGMTHECQANHPVWVRVMSAGRNGAMPGEFTEVEARELLPGDTLGTDQGLSRVASVRQSEDQTSWVYDLKTDSQALYVSGVAAHNSFHSGGTFGTGNNINQGFARLNELLTAPDIIKGQGTLADLSGKVTRIRPAPQGGYYVTVDSTEHYVLPGTPLLVKEGDTIEHGHPISGGSYRPQEIAAKRGNLEAQKYVTEEIRKAYESAGETVRKPVIEVVVASMMRYVEITNDGGEHDLAVGDVMHENEYEARKAKNARITAKPYVPGLSMKPIETSKDMFSRMNYQRLEDTAREVPAMGGKSDLSGTTGSPLAGFAYGKSFREGQAAHELPEITHFDSSFVRS